MDVDARARKAADLAAEINDLIQALDVMPACERVGLISSLEQREAELRRLMRV